MPTAIVLEAAMDLPALSPMATLLLPVTVLPAPSPPTEQVLYGQLGGPRG